MLIYNKPEGQVTTREDPEGRPTIFEALPRLKGARWIAVGRLDINTTGLLLLTTDGELANALMHPSNAIEREYVCRIPGEVPENVVDRLARGVALEDGPAKFEKIERINASGSHSWFQVVLTEGRNREVRRLWESQGHQVSRLKRVRYGDVTLPRLLKRGHCVEMEAEQVEKLRKQFGLEHNAPVLTLQPVIGQRKSRPIGDPRRQGPRAEFLRQRPRQRRSARVAPLRPRARGEVRAAAAVPAQAPRRGKPGGYKGAAASPSAARWALIDRCATRPARGGKRSATRPARATTISATASASGRRRSSVRAARSQAAGRASLQRSRRARRAARSGPAWSGRGPRCARRSKPQGQCRTAPAASTGHGPHRAEFRSWYVPEGVETGSKVAPPRSQRHGGPASLHADSAVRVRRATAYGQRRRAVRVRGGGDPRGPGGPGGPGGNRGPGGPGGTVSSRRTRAGAAARRSRPRTGTAVPAARVAIAVRAQTVPSAARASGPQAAWTSSKRPERPAFGRLRHQPA